MSAEQTKIGLGIKEDRVGQLPLQEALRVTADATIREVVEAMRGRRIGCALVDDAAGRLRGIFTERDYLCRVIRPGRDLDGAIGEVMTPSPSRVHENDTVWQAIEMMHDGGFRHLPVVDSGNQVTRLCTLKVIVSYLVEYFPTAVYNLPPSSDQPLSTREGA